VSPPGVSARPMGRQSVQLHEHTDEAALVAAVAAALRTALMLDRDRNSEALLLLSGGATPIPIYRALAPHLADVAPVTLALVDERWVGPDDAGSNARMLRETLLSEPAPGVRFWPLADLPAGIEAAVAQANARLRASALVPSMVVFGMGDDGHTASLFPGSADLPRALASVDPYVALDATGCPVAGQWPRRITLTPAGWRNARHRLLVIRGERKRQVFERAQREQDPLDLPIAAAIEMGSAPLNVHWSP